MDLPVEHFIRFSLKPKSHNFHNVYHRQTPVPLISGLPQCDLQNKSKDTYFIFFVIFTVQVFKGMKGCSIVTLSIPGLIQDIIFSALWQTVYSRGLFETF